MAPYVNVQHNMSVVPRLRTENARSRSPETTFGSGFFRPRMRALRDSHRDLEFENVETLKQQKFDILKEIRQLKLETEALKRELEAKVRDHDESELAEIEVYNRTVTERNMGRQSQRVLTGSKRLLELQDESLALDKKIETLRFNFSDDALHRIRTSVCIQKNEIANAREELAMYVDVLEQARGELQGPDMAQGVSVCEDQREKVRELRRELAHLQDEGDELEAARDEESREKSATYRGDAEIGKLERRLANLQHVKEGRKKDMEALKEKIDIQVSVMNGVHEKERTNRRYDERNRALATRTRRYKPLGRKKMDGDGEETMTRRDESEYEERVAIGDERSQASSVEKGHGGSSSARKSGSGSGRSSAKNASEKSRSSEKKRLSEDFDKESSEKGQSSEKKQLSEDFDKESSEKGRSSEKRPLSEDFDKESSEKSRSSAKKRMSEDFDKESSEKGRSSEKKPLSEDFDKESSEKGRSSEKKQLSEDFDKESSEKGQSSEKRPLSEDFDKESSEKGRSSEKKRLSEEFDKESSEKSRSSAKKRMSEDFDKESSEKRSSEKRPLSEDFDKESSEKGQSSEKKQLSEDFDKESSEKGRSSEKKPLSEDFDKESSEKKMSSGHSAKKALSNEFESAERKDTNETSEDFDMGSNNKAGNKNISEEFSKESSEKGEDPKPVSDDFDKDSMEPGAISNDFESTEEKAKPGLSDDFEKEASDRNDSDSSGDKADMSNDFDESAERNKSNELLSADFD